MREIDCAHRKTLKTLFQKFSKKFFENFSPKNAKVRFFGSPCKNLRNPKAPFKCFPKKEFAAAAAAAAECGVLNGKVNGLAEVPAEPHPLPVALNISPDELPPRPPFNEEPFPEPCPVRRPSRLFPSIACWSSLGVLRFSRSHSKSYRYFWYLKNILTTKKFFIENDHTRGPSSDIFSPKIFIFWAFPA
jgi:hypothetical protein